MGIKNCIATIYIRYAKYTRRSPINVLRQTYWRSWKSLTYGPLAAWNVIIRQIWNTYTEWISNDLIVMNKNVCVLIYITYTLYISKNHTGCQRWNLDLDDTRHPILLFYILYVVLKDIPLKAIVLWSLRWTFANFVHTWVYINLGWQLAINHTNPKMANRYVQKHC